MAHRVAHRMAQRISIQNGQAEGAPGPVEGSPGPAMTEAEYAQAVERLLPLLERKARRLVGRVEALDVVHNAVINVWRAPRAGVADLRALLLHAVGNAAKDYLSSANRALSTATYFTREEPRPGPVDEDQLIARVDLQRALTALPADVAHALRAVYVDGARWSEVAAELGVPAMTLHDRVQRHLPALRAQLARTGVARTGEPTSPSVKGGGA